MERLNILRKHVQASLVSAEGKESFTVVDNRTGKFNPFSLHTIIGETYEFPLTNNTINSKDLGKIKDQEGNPTRYYDPGYTNTVNCVSPSP